MKNNMNSKNINLIVLICITIFGSACSTFNISKPKHHQVTLKDNAWIKENNQEPIQKNLGDTIEVKETPVLIESPGHVGVVLVPVSKSSAKFDLKLQPIMAWGGKRIEEHANKVVSTILTETFQAQALLGQGNAREALSLIKDLGIKYPKVSYLKFVEASCLVVLGNNSKAVSTLKSALESFPDNEDALALYKSLTGKPFEQGGE